MKSAKTKMPVPDTPEASAPIFGGQERERSEAAKPFAVYCEKVNGRRHLFQRYATKKEAEAVAKTLQQVGCRALVGAPE